jgi:hypothetical protein
VQTIEEKPERLKKGKFQTKKQLGMKTVAFHMKNLADLLVLLIFDASHSQLTAVWQNNASFVEPTVPSFEDRGQHRLVIQSISHPFADDYINLHNIYSDDHPLWHAQDGAIISTDIGSCRPIHMLPIYSRYLQTVAFGVI